MKTDVLHSLHHDTLASKVYASLEAAILHGKIKPGDRLIEDELSAAFGISRAPIREALRSMERDGLVCVIPRRGVVVNDISNEDMDESYEILSVLEGLAARIFCEKAGEEELANLQKLCTRMEAHVQNRNFSEYRKLNKEFHAVFVDGSRNKKIKELHSQIRKQIDWFQNVTLSLKGRPEVSLKEHKQILNAFLQRDADRAERDVRKHVIRASQYLKEAGGRRTIKWFKSSANLKGSPQR